MRNYFSEIWNLHFKWGQGVLYEEIQDVGFGKVILSPVPGEYYNFVVPSTMILEDIDFEAIGEIFARKGEKSSFFLLEEQQQYGFVELLVRKGFILESRDCWVGFDADSKVDASVGTKIVNVNEENYNDYLAVLGTVFRDFPGNDKYLDICRKTLTGELKSANPELKSELYLIYEGGKAVAGAGMFYDQKENFAYLHDAGTLEGYRGKGYQSDLLKFRTNKALELEIDRIYCSVEHGSKSWSNCVKNGFVQLHTGNIFISK